MQIGAVALEEGMRRDRQEDVEIAGRPAAQSSLPLPGQANAGAVLDAGRDVDRERALAGGPAETAAGGAGLVDHLAAAMTGRAGALQGEEALGVANLALAAAGRARLRLGAGLGAVAAAGFAGDRGRNPDLGVLAAIGLLEGEFHVVAQV